MKRCCLLILLILLIQMMGFNSLAFSNELNHNSRADNEHLLPCDHSSSCVVSHPEEGAFYIAPIIYQGDEKEAKDMLLKVLSVVPQTRVVDIKDNYIRAESKSKIFGIIDDVEFYFIPNSKTIEIRSASRKLKFDLGVNRRRLEQIRLALKELKV